MELPDAFSLNLWELHRDRRDKTPIPLIPDHYPPLPELEEHMCNAHPPCGPFYKGPADGEHRLCNWHSPALTFGQAAVGGVEMNGKDGLGALEDKNRAEVRQGKRIYC